MRRVEIADDMHVVPAVSQRLQVRQEHHVMAVPVVRKHAEYASRRHAAAVRRLQKGGNAEQQRGNGGINHDRVSRELIATDCRRGTNEIGVRTKYRTRRAA